jgi:hypothetical protein
MFRLNFLDTWRFMTMLADAMSVIKEVKSWRRGTHHQVKKKSMTAGARSN